MKNVAAALVFPLCLASLALACRPQNKDPRTPASRLSSLNINEFKVPAGKTAWKSGKILMKEASASDPVADQSFKAGANGSGAEILQLTVPYGNYKVQLEYFADEDGKTLLYRSCALTPGQDPTYPVSTPRTSLAIEICDAKGSARQGSTPGTTNANVAITPVLKDASPSSKASRGAVKYTAKSSAVAGSKGVIAITFEFESQTNEPLYCEFMADLALKRSMNAGSLSTYIIESDLLLYFPKKGHKEKVEHQISGADIFGEVNTVPSLVNYEVFGVCFSSKTETIEYFDSNCSDDPNSFCDSMVIEY